MTTSTAEPSTTDESNSESRFLRCLLSVLGMPDEEALATREGETVRHSETNLLVVSDPEATGEAIRAAREER